MSTRFRHGEDLSEEGFWKRVKEEMEKEREREMARTRKLFFIFLIVVAVGLFVSIKFFA